MHSTILKKLESILIPNNNYYQFFRTALINLKNMNKELATKHRAPKAPPKLELGKWLETLAGMGEQQAVANSIVKLKLDTNRFGIFEIKCPKKAWCQRREGLWPSPYSLPKMPKNLEQKSNFHLKIIVNT